MPLLFKSLLSCYRLLITSKFPLTYNPSYDIPELDMAMTSKTSIAVTRNSFMNILFSMRSLIPYGNNYAVRYCSSAIISHTLSSISTSSGFVVPSSSPSLPGIMRTHTCGGLRSCHVGEDVILSGWINARRKSCKDGSEFWLLRDAYGIIQVYIESDIVAKCNMDIDVESVVCIHGKVNERPSYNIKHDIRSGDIEVNAVAIDIVNGIKQPPFQPCSLNNLPSENIRQHHRYLDLRRPTMQHTLRTRSKVNKIVRDYLDSYDFVEVETPTLVRPTPEGSQEFLVPTDHHNQYYALAQSPQQYKQILMAGGLDRYYQIARCYRNEGMRADRQPEFTQLDLELSFGNEESVREIIEGLLKRIWKNILDVSVPRPFPQITYNDAMSRYGSDKPDIRFSWEITPLDDVLRGSGICHFDPRNIEDGVGDITVLGINAKDAASISRKNINEIFKMAIGKQSIDDSKEKTLLFALRVGEDGAWFGGGSRFSNATAATRAAVNSRLGASQGDLLFLCSTSRNKPDYAALGRTRVLAAQTAAALGSPIFDKTPWQFLWVVDFPLFENNDDGSISSTHHPFTAPCDMDVPAIYSDNKTSVRGRHYDIVLNGVELGGGSVRIHNRSLQEYILSDVLRINSEKFSHLLDALSAGCPPHAGIALGLDRVMSLLLKTNSLRDVIAFPKSFSGRCLLTGAPTSVDSKGYSDDKSYLN